jgi:hypothetical protein
VIIPGSKRVSMRAGVICRANSSYVSAGGAGPAGSSLMTFFTIVTLKRVQTTVGAFFFSRYSGSGWLIYEPAAAIQFYATNSTPTDVVTPSFTITQSMVGIPLILLARYNGVPNPGNIEGWINGVSTGITTLGTGYTAPPGAAPTAIGSNSTAGGNPFFYTHACGMLNTYDVAASYNTAFGTGGAGLTAQWMEDLQQGRYLTDPTGGALGANLWYWDAKDAVVGAATKTWIDRGPNAVSIPRAGTVASPHGSSVRMVF